MKTEERKRDKEGVVEALKEFEDYFLPREYFFPDDFAEKIKNFKNDLAHHSTNFEVLVVNLDGAPPNSDPWHEANNYLKNEAVEIKKWLKKEIQKLLGLINE